MTRQSGMWMWVVLAACGGVEEQRPTVATEATVVQPAITVEEAEHRRKQAQPILNRLDVAIQHNNKEEQQQAFLALSELLVDVDTDDEYALAGIRWIEDEKTARIIGRDLYSTFFSAMDAVANADLLFARGQCQTVVDLVDFRLAQVDGLTEPQISAMKLPELKTLAAQCVARVQDVIDQRASKMDEMVAPKAW